MASRRRPTSTDVELRRLELRYSVLRQLARGAVWAICIAAAALPLLTVGRAAEPFAGESTVVDVNLALSISVAVSVVLNGLQSVLASRRKQELNRLRDRVRHLESELGLGPGE